MDIPNGPKTKFPKLASRCLTPKWFHKLLADHHDDKLDKEAVEFEVPHRLSELQPLFRSDEKFSVLANLLKEKPRLITHPVVWGLIEHLRRVSTDPISREEADGYLANIIQCWIRGMLPGWMLTAPRKKKGRKITWEEIEFRAWLTQEYEGLLKLFRPAPLKMQPNESHDTYRQRLTQLMARVNETWHPPLSVKKRSQGHAKQPSAKSSPSHLRFPSLHKPLAPEKISRWLSDEKLNEIGSSLSYDFLAQCLLGHQH